MLNLIRKYKVTLIIILLIITSFLFIYFKKYIISSEVIYDLGQSDWENRDESEVTTKDEKDKVEGQVNEQVPVFICGEIKVPGVYYIESQTIINELITKAGGFTKEANQTQVNLARTISPNEKIYIPKLGEEIDKTTNSYDNEEGQNLGSILVNINTADNILLDTLPGIGASRATNIIAYREQNGRFKTIEELQNVPGIGGKIYESLKGLITVE